MKRVKYSIIIPVYNKISYINACLEQVSHNSRDDIEIIVIDDGSDDGSGAVCDKFANKDKRIQVFHQTNKGVSYTRNRGISLSIGEYILFLDSDDSLDEEIWDDLDEVLEKSDVDIVLFGFREIYSDKIIECKADNSNKLLNRESIVNEIVKLYQTYTLHAIGTKLYKRQFLVEKKLQFISEWSYCEDVFFCLSALEKCQTLFILSDIYYNYYRNDTNSLATQFSYSDVDAVYKTFELLKKICGSGLSKENEILWNKSRIYAIKHLVEKYEQSKVSYLQNFYVNYYYTQKTKILEFLNKYSSVALYGMGLIGRDLLIESIKNGIHVVYVVDRAVDYVTDGVVVKKPQDFLEPVDFFLITSFSDVETVLSQLQKTTSALVMDLGSLLLHMNFSSEKGNEHC